MLTQQDIYVVGSENRPPMLNKDNYVLWSSRLLRYTKSKPNGKLLVNSIKNGPYTDDELTKKEVKQIEDDDQVIQTIRMGLPKDIYAANANQNGNGNVVAARAEGNGNRNNQASTSDTQTDKAPVYDSNGSAEVHNYDGCYDNDIFNMFTQEEQYTELLEPIIEPHTVQQNNSNVISVESSVEHKGGTVEQHPATVKETRAYFESLYYNLVNEVVKFNTVNHKMKETNTDLTTELARYKGQEKSFEINMAKFKELETDYKKSVYQEQCLTKMQKREWGGRGVKEKNGVAPSAKEMNKVVKDGVIPSITVASRSSSGTQAAKSVKAGHDNLHDENVGETPSTFTPDKGETGLMWLSQWSLLEQLLNGLLIRHMFSSMEGLDVMLEMMWVMFWFALKLHGVPVTAFSEDGLSTIATKIGTPLMLDSYTSACAFNHGDECPKNKVSDVVKNMKKPSYTHKGVLVGPKVGFQPTKQVYRQVSKKNNVSTSENNKKDAKPIKEVNKSNSFDVLNLVENDNNFEGDNTLIVIQSPCYSASKDFQDSPDDEEDTRSNHEYLNDLEEEYQARALLAKSKRFFKKCTQRFSSAKAPDQLNVIYVTRSVTMQETAGQELQFPHITSMVKNKCLIVEAYKYDKEEVSSDDNEMVEVKVLMTLAKENNDVNKEGARNGKWIKISVRKRILGVGQLTKDPSSLGQKDLVFVKSSADDIKVTIPGVERPWLFKTESFIMPNHDTGRILLAELQRNTTDHSVDVTDSSVIIYDLANESLVCSTPLPLLKKLDGAEPIS
nr:retrovirus-related Pol polyprotein from transposon TNT 1-94 [Tanacetum cinerariifolium]